MMQFRCITLLTPFQQQTIAWTEPELPPLQIRSNSAMLIYRSTPIRPGQLSPADLLTQRKYRALLPIHQYLHPNLEKSREAQIAQKQTQADYYNQKAKRLQDLRQYQNVRVQLDPNKPVWRKATVIQQPTDRSPRRYQVQTESILFQKPSTNQKS